MNRSKITNQKRAGTRNTKKSASVTKESCPLSPFITKAGAVVEPTAECESCDIDVRTILDFRLDLPSPVTGAGIIPCKSDDELRSDLKTLLASPPIQVTVAGGILRHSIR